MGDAIFKRLHNNLAHFCSILKMFWTKTPISNHANWHSIALRYTQIFEKNHQLHTKLKGENIRSKIWNFWIFPEHKFW